MVRRDPKTDRERPHPLSVPTPARQEGSSPRMARASELGDRFRQGETVDHAEAAPSSKSAWLRRILLRMMMRDPDLELDMLQTWWRTLRDRRFYSSSKGLSFDVIDRYFRQHGFEYSRGMSLKPQRRVISRIREVSGLLHPREQIHVVAPGDPIFAHALASQSHGSSRGNLLSSRSPDGSAYEFDAASSARFLDVPPPTLIITSQRILTRSETDDGPLWISHFYSYMVDEAPAILSWSEEEGWHRALDNSESRYYCSVRYYDILGQRLFVSCPDTNSSALVSWIIQAVCERNDRRHGSQGRGSASARAFASRNVEQEHLNVPNLIAAATHLVDHAAQYEVALQEPPAENPEDEEFAGATAGRA